MCENKIYEKLSKLNNMNTFSLFEKYDISNAQKLLHSEIVDEEYKGSLKKYLKFGKGGKVEVELLKKTKLVRITLICGATLNQHYVINIM